MKKNMKEVLFSTPEKNYPGDYQKDLMELYHLYVEMTDRISQRRASANQWFLAMNTALLTATGYFLTKTAFPWAMALISVAGAIICYLWYRLILSYQQMNSGRFEVVHAIEEKLPLKIYEAEWIALGEGKDPNKYKPFTDVEKMVPIIFGALYILLGIATMIKIFGSS